MENPAADQVLAVAEKLDEEAVRRLRTWVERNSHSGDVAGVNAMGELLVEAFALPELSLDRQAGNGVGDHLCWRTPAFDQAVAAGQPRTVLIGHHDTVFPPGTFEGWMVDAGDPDKIVGPGALDMKGGLVIIWTALKAFSQAGRLADLPVALVCVGDEEIGSEDSAPFTRRWADGAAAALVFEAGRADDRIITARKGTGGIHAAVTGTAAHAGNYHREGKNAIEALARFIVEAEERTDYDRGLTVNVGLVRGGTSRNTVPGDASCDIDFRFEIESDGPALVDNLRELADRIAGETETSFELSGGVKRPPLVPTDASRALYARYAAAARQSGLGGDEHPLLGGGSDGNNVASLGVPVIDGLGPRGFGFHTSSEHIFLSSLPLKTAALVRFLVG